MMRMIMMRMSSIFTMKKYSRWCRGSMYSIDKLHCRKNIAMLPSPEGKYTVGFFWHSTKVVHGFTIPLTWWWWYSQGTTRLYHTPQKTNMVHLKIIQIEKEHHLNQASIFFGFKMFVFRCVHPWNLTYPRKINSWKMWFLFSNGPFLWGISCQFSGGVSSIFLFTSVSPVWDQWSTSQSLPHPPLLLHDCKAMPRVHRKWWTTSSRASCKTMGNPIG